MYERLVRFERDHGSCDVTKNDPDRRLSQWVHYIRAMRRQKRVPAERDRRLEGLGFRFEVFEVPRDAAAVLKLLRRKTPRDRLGKPHIQTALADPAAGPYLRRWIKERRKGALLPAIERDLSRLGLLDDPGRQDAEWEEWFQRLQSHRRMNGAVNPVAHSRLGIWLRGQRSLLRKGLLPNDRAERLTRCLE